MSSPFNVISLFAGCGRSSTGYEMAGGKILLAVEWDNNAIETYKANHPETSVYHGDIGKLSVDEILYQTGLQVGDLDILDGSPPCQGFSTAGKRRVDDPRNQLFQEYVRILRGVKPKVFIMENVSGMVKGKMKLIFAEILKELKESGYKVKVRLMNAMYYGVPQSRQRLIFIGIRKDFNIEPDHPNPQKRTISLKEILIGLGNTQNISKDHIWIDESPKGKNTKTYHLALKAHPGQKYAGTQKRTDCDKPSPTLLKPGTENIKIPPYLRNSHCHPVYTRTFSLLEYKRISSFPDDYVFCGMWWEGYYRIANSVPPLLMKAIATHINENVLQKINGVNT